MLHEPLAKLPVLKLPADGESVRPVVVVDSREQAPLVFTRLPSIRAGLDSGDYSMAGCETLFAVERKSIGDLVTCCAGERERFERELLRLRGYRFKRLLIIGSPADVESGQYRSRMNPRAVLHTLAAFEVRYDLPIVWASTPEAGALKVESWAWWFAREIVNAANGACAEK